MAKSIEKSLCLHGALIMFIAFVSGGMIAAAVLGQVDGSKADWTLAHMEALVNSLVLFAIAGCIGKLALTPAKSKTVAVCLIAMAYCNAVFGFMRGMTGALGYQFDGSLANDITTFAGMLGVPLGIVAFALIALGALKSGTPAES